jgi:hypothetical protein
MRGPQSAERYHVTVEAIARDLPKEQSRRRYLKKAILDKQSTPRSAMILSSVKHKQDAIQGNGFIPKTTW